MLSLGIYGLLKITGMNPHEDLRKFILDEWEKEKNFEKLLKKCVNYLKAK